MRDALVLNGARNLDFQDIRQNVIRIPEVVGRLREAQMIWDDLVDQPMDLFNFVAEDNARFKLGPSELVAAIVQIGLIDRYLSTHTLPNFVLATSAADPVLRFVRGRLEFVDLILTYADRTPAAEIKNTPALYARDEADRFARILTANQGIEKLFVDLVDRHEVGKVVLLGPGNTVFGRRVLELAARDVQIHETIDLDPMLTWFWSNVRENRLAIAN